MVRDFSDPERCRDPGPRTLLRSMERYLAGEQPVKDAAVHEVQQLVYDAWEAPTHEEELELMKQALKLDPANVDALLHGPGIAPGELAAERKEFGETVLAERLRAALGCVTAK